MTTPNLQILISAKNLASKDIDRIHADVGRLNKSVGILSNTFKGLAGITAGFGLAELGKSFIDTGIYIDRMRRSMEAISGSSIVATQNMDFLKRKSDEFGQIYRDQVKGFNLISAATKGTRLEGRATQQMYSDLMASMTAFQLSQDDAYNAVRAIQQMLAKGNIQAEEFRGQFGERIPVAFEAMKLATASTSKELQEMMKKGELISEKVVPRLLRAMALMTEEGLGKAIKSAQSEINRLLNSFDYFKIAVMDSGITMELTSTLADMSDSIRDYLKNNDKEIAEFIKNSISLTKTVLGEPVEGVGLLLTAVKDTVVAVTNSVDSLLNKAKGSFLGDYGVLGYYLLGPKAGMLMTALHEVIAVANLSKGQGLVKSGALSSEKFSNMDFKELKSWLKDFDEAMKNQDVEWLDSQRLEATTASIKKLRSEIEALTKDRAKKSPTLLDIGGTKDSIRSALKISSLTTELNKKLREQADLEKKIFDIRSKSKEVKGETVEERKARIENEKEQLRLEALREKQIAQRLGQLSKTVDAQQKIKDILQKTSIDANKISGSYSESDVKVARVREELLKIKKSLFDQHGIHIDINDALGEAGRLYREAYSVSDTKKVEDALNKLNASTHLSAEELSGMFSAQEIGIKKIEKQYSALAKKFEDKKIDVDLTPDTNKAIDEYKKAIQALNIRNSFKDGVSNGVSSGFSEAIKSTVVSRSIEFLSESIGQAISKSIMSSVSMSVGSSASQAVGGLAGGLIGGVAGAAVGSVVGGVFGGGSGGITKSVNELAEFIAKNRELIDEFKKNREEVKRNTAALIKTGMSSYSGDLQSMSESFLDSSEKLREDMKELKDYIKKMSNTELAFGADVPSGSAREYMGLLKDLEKRYDFPTEKIFDKYGQISEDLDIDDLIENADAFNYAVDVINSGALKLSDDYKDAMLTLFEGITTSIDNFVANLSTVRREIVSASDSLLKTAKNAFLSDSEIAAQSLADSSRDMISGLLETFQKEGALLLTDEFIDFGLFKTTLPSLTRVTDDYIQSVVELTSVEEMAFKLMSDFSMNQDAVNQILTVTNNLIETRVLQERKYAQSLRDTMQGAMSSIYDAYEELDFSMSGLTRKAWVQARIKDFETVFDTVGRLSEEEFSTYVGFVRELFDIQMEQEETRVEYIKQSTEKIKNLVASIDSTIFSIQTGSLNVSTAKTKAEEMIPIYEELYEAAKTPGDEEATQKFIDFAQQYLQIYQNAYKSSENYINMYNKVVSDLTEIKGVVQTEDYMKKLVEIMESENNLTSYIYYNTRDTSQLMQVNNNRLVEIRDSVIDGFINLTNASGFSEIKSTLDANFANLINTINVTANVGNTGAPVYYEPPSPAVAPSVPTPSQVETPGYSTEPANTLTFSNSGTNQQSLAAKYYTDRIASMDLGTIALFNAQLNNIPNVETILESPIMKDWHDMFEMGKTATDVIITRLPGGGKLYLYQGALTYQSSDMQTLKSFQQSDSINYVASRVPELAAFWRTMYGISDFSMYSLPGYEREGIARTPQVAKLAESQPEVIMNFERFMKLIDALEKMTSGTGGGGQNITIKIGDEVIDRVVMKRVGKYMTAQDRRGVTVGEVYR